MSNVYMSVMLLSVGIASVSQLLLKKSTMKKYATLAGEYFNPLVISGYGLLFISMLLTVYAYSGMDYKNGPIIESLGNVFVLVLGCLFLKEKITMRKLAGIACIICGMAVFYM